MATYFHGGQEVQTDSLQTLYLMNPNYVGYTDAAAAPANMVLLNSMNSMNPMSFANAGGQHNSQQQHIVGIPLQPMLPTQESASATAAHDISGIHGLVPRLHYNLWAAPPPSATSIDMASPQFNPHRPPSTRQQGLSLSLSSREMVSPVGEITPSNAEEAAGHLGGSNGLQSFLMGSRYLKAAQQLLDEVVNVGKGGKGEAAKGATSKSSAKNTEDSEGRTSAQEEPRVELSTAERQELQMKKAKLVNMLDEVEQRYRQYHQQMQIVVSAFEAVAGSGSARTYTALALQTISKQFRCLRDAIAGQIQATSRSLGEEETDKAVGSRLRFVDHHLRQQRALQQLGMIQHNAWRPQRGLPERSVSILRAWLFEHFLHPYPKDSDKLMLAKQTGLTRSQVSNWFINARVRLWKPMVEEMYLEETKDQEQNNAEENATESGAKKENEAMSSSQQENGIAKAEQNEKVTMASQQGGYYDDDDDDEDEDDREAAAAASMLPKRKKARSLDESLHHPNAMSEEMSNRELLMKFMEGSGGVEEQGYSLMGSNNTNSNNVGGFAAYPIGEMERFGSEQFTPRFSSNSVSLTLGLQHCETLSLSAAQPSFLSNESMAMGRRIQVSSEGNDYSSNTNPSNAYDQMDMQSRKRFAAQLMRDFVA
ncbi:BEL1-like homeodomain protein 1 [Typha angustifolia]|uniref:BEL1-like homeodomain protein 1 n=1 Tax=Typha angustifolia TaxID=59011 RepID=UPI003C2E4B12